MEKEDFIGAQSSIKNEIAGLNDLLKKLRNEYIEQNSSFEIGEKVKVIYPPRKNWANDKMIPERIEFGFVESFEISSDAVFPVLLESKKDGSKSKRRLYYNNDCVISRVSEHTGGLAGN